MNLAKNFQENVTGIQHLGIPTTDLKKTMAFYGELGFENIWDNGEVSFMQLGNLVIEFYTVDESAMLSGAIDHVSLNVKDVEAAWRDAQACGYETEDSGVNFLPFFEKGVRFFTIVGPNREKIEFNQML